MRAKRIRTALFIVSTGVILWLTIFSRQSSGVHQTEMRLMWGLQEMIAGNPNWKQFALYWIENVLLFIPFGLLFPKNDYRVVLLSGFLMSICIETVQYFGCLGLCELDDVICNTLGSLSGFLLAMETQRIISNIQQKKSD